jgi:NodT family efflux transporter outer membrane factor (OMF) lipoprotein
MAAWLALMLEGCTALGPDFVNPDAGWAPASWFAGRRPPEPAQASRLVEDAPDQAWWGILGDPVLTGLEGRLAEGNLDLRVAEARLVQARASLGISQAATLPTVSGNAGYSREQESRRGILRLTNAYATPLGAPYDLFQYGFDLSWEADLWGRVRRGVEQARAQVDAAAEAVHGVQVTASAELARDYVVLRGVQAKYRITRANLESARASLALTRARAAGGLTNDLDVANAATQVATVEAELPALERQRDALMNAIALLLGAGPRALERELAVAGAVPPVPPRVKVGIPVELLRRRPDIREAEANLHAATAAIGVATADFYPRLTLGGSGSIQGLQLGNLAEWSAQAYSVGPSLSLPIFEGGRLRRTLELRTAQQQEAGLLWRTRFLTALHEVDDALTAYGSEQVRRGRLVAAAESARRALALARERYALGVADFLQVLTAQRAQLASEQDLVDSTTLVATNLVQLYKALGGGWQ